MWCIYIIINLFLRFLRLRSIPRVGRAESELHSGVRPAIRDSVQEVEAWLRHRGAGHQLGGRLRRVGARRHQDISLGSSYW